MYKYVARTKTKDIIAILSVYVNLHASKKKTLWNVGTYKFTSFLMYIKHNIKSCMVVKKRILNE